jgi:hypothetical protein
MGFKEFFAAARIVSALTGNPDPDSLDKKVEAARYINTESVKEAERNSKADVNDSWWSLSE